MKKLPWKQIFVIVFLGVGVFIVIEIFKVISAGEKDFMSIITAPWTALKKVWTSITSFFGSFGSATPGTVAGTGQTPAQLVGVDASSLVGQMLDSQTNVDDVNSQLVLGTSTLPVTSGDQVVGIWGTGADLSTPSP